MFVGKTLSIAQLAEEHLALQALLQFDEPVTDYAYTDSEGEDTPQGSCKPWIRHAQMAGPVPPPTASSVRKRKRKARSNNYRKSKRTKAQAQAQTDGGTAPRGIALRHLVQAAKDALQLDFDIEANAAVALTGWQGRRMSPPKEVFTKDFLVKEQGMHYFAWDGL